MIDKLFICYETLSKFLEDLNAGKIKSTSIVFIEDTHQIFTHDTYYGQFDSRVVPTGGVENDRHLILSSDLIFWLFTTFANANGLLIPWVEYTVSYSGNVDSFYVNSEIPKSTTVFGGNSIYLFITARSGYTIDTVTYKMKGLTYTADVVTGGYFIQIPTVSSNVEIIVTTTDKPYKFSIEDDDTGEDDVNMVSSTVARGTRFAMGEEFLTRLTIANGYEFASVEANMEGYNHNPIYEESNPGFSNCTIPAHPIDVTGNISIVYTKQAKHYTIDLDTNTNWGWYQDSQKLNEITSVSHEYGTATNFYVFGKDSYEISAITVVDSTSDYGISYDPTTGEVTIPANFSEDGIALSVVGDYLNVQLNNQLSPTSGFTLKVYREDDSQITPTPTELTANETYTFEVSLNSDYTVTTVPAINGNPMTLENNSYVETIDVGTSNVTITGTAKHWPSLTTNLQGFELVVKKGSNVIEKPAYLEMGSTYTFTVTLQSGYEYSNAPTINSVAMSGSDRVYEETMQIDVNTPNVVIAGTATAIVYPSYWGMCAYNTPIADIVPTNGTSFTSDSTLTSKITTGGFYIAYPTAKYSNFPSVTGTQVPQTFNRVDPGYTSETTKTINETNYVLWAYQLDVPMATIGDAMNITFNN